MTGAPKCKTIITGAAGGMGTIVLIRPPVVV
ncbi:MAG: hypothetical protein RL367_2303 [Pseudomonadota bacterium]|jgi:hypothetical protein